MPLVKVLCALVAAVPVYAGVIRGVTLENATGLPLARTRIKLERVQPDGSRRQVATASTGPVGQFFFSPVPSGLYTVTATRLSYAPTLFRVKAEDMRTAVVEVSPHSDVFAQIRMKKLGVVTGRVLDDNKVGIPGVRVLAYRARLPMEAAGSGQSDDRGAYRIFGLNAGKYWIRTAQAALEDGPGLLPTFFPHGTQSRDARLVEVAPDRETSDVDLRPAEGTLINVTLTAVACLQGEKVTLVVAMDTGRQTTELTCGPSGTVAHTFQNLPPGEVELLSHAGTRVAWQLRSIARNEQVTLQLSPAEAIKITSEPKDVRPIIRTRRRDLAGVHEEIVYKPGLFMLPGMWEFTADALSGYFLHDIRSYAGGRPGLQTEWFPVFCPPYTSTWVSVVLRSGPASLAGQIRYRGEPAANAPVHLYPVEAITRMRIGGNRLVFSDSNGRYRFADLPPGNYLAGAAFDVFEVDEDAMVAAKAQPVTLTPGQELARDLSLPDQ